MEMNEMTGSSLLHFCVLPAEHQLTIPCTSLGLDPPNFSCQSLLCKTVCSAWVTLDYNDINLRNIISEDYEMNNKMVTSFKTIKSDLFVFFIDMEKSEKKVLFFTIFNT